MGWTMTIFRYKGNGLLYTITSERGRGPYKAHPYKHDVEIGVKFTSHARYRDFKSGMTLDDFEAVAEC
jgi:hypothetical protein